MAEIDYTAIERLGDLYGKYHRDFILLVSHDLTEPTCPSAQIEDNDGEIVARAEGDTIEEAINKAVQIACDRLLDGKDVSIWPDALGTDPNDMSKPKKYPQRGTEEGMMDRDIIIAAFRSGALFVHTGGSLADLQRAAETFADLVEMEQNEAEAPGAKRKEVMSRHPYTYAADFMRAHGPSRPIVGDICGPILSRADASYLRHKIAAAIGMSDAELAEKLSLAYQAEQSGTETLEAKRME